MLTREYELIARYLEIGKRIGIQSPMGHVLWAFLLDELVSKELKSVD